MKEIIKHLENMAETLDGVTEENWADSPADIAAIYRSVANETKSKIEKHHHVYELPRDIQLHRFKGEKIVKLIGQYRNEENHEHPNHIYTIEVHKGDAAAVFVRILEDDNCLMTINFNGSSVGAEYVAIKALKAVLNRRDSRNLRKRNQKKKRQELKKAAQER